MHSSRWKGGPKDPKIQEHWAAYTKIKHEKMPHLAGKGKGKGDTKGKGKGDKDGGKKGGKGGGKTGGKVKTARASAVTASEGLFPKGALGLDSWANVLAEHVDPDTVDEWNSSLTLAHGECPCKLFTGKKGIPTAQVPYKDGCENIDLLPLGWLWSRGCDYKWNQAGPTLKSPKDRYLKVWMWGLLPYLMAEDAKKLFDDLPPAEAPGRKTGLSDPMVSEGFKS